MTTAELTQREREIILHSLGMPNKGKRPYRNHFVTGEGSTDWPTCEGLAAKGLMRKFAGNPLTGGEPCFVVTREGCALVGTEPPR